MSITLDRLKSAWRTTPWPGASLCATWTTQVFSNAGAGWFGGNACDQYRNWCNRPIADVQPGMIVAVPSWPGTSAGKVYGHVGIYIGNGTVRHSVTSGVQEMPLTKWVSLYGQTHTVKCGWMGGVQVVSSGNATATAPNTTSNGGFDLSTMQTIYSGSRGNQVKTLQAVLNGRYGCSLAVDGIFGNDTKYCVGLFQSKHGLANDGVVGPNTWRKLLAE